MFIAANDCAIHSSVVVVVVSDVDVRETTAPLPQDLESAHRLIAELVQRESVLCKQVEADQRRIASLEQQVHWLRNYVFGRRSEKGVPEEQQALPFASAAGEVEEAASDEDDATAQEIEVPAHRRRRGGRKPLPEDLPREIIELEPADEDLRCKGCDAEKTRIGEDRTEELDYQPASFFIREYVRPKYACRKCEDGVTQAELPARPIEKGRPGPGLLAHVVTSKYGDHLPLYRLERIFGRHGVEISRSTLSEWCGAVSDLLRPVARQIAVEVLGSTWIQSDDTTVEVQDRSRSPAYPKGHIWVYRGADGSAFYDFTWKRNSEGPLRILEQYRGHLQADAAPAYDDVYAKLPIVEVGCWAHARRRFKEAVRTSPKEASYVVALIGELYGLERSAKKRKLGAEDRKQLRQQQSVPTLDRIHEYLKKITVTALPKSPLAEAIGYALRQWEALCRYTEDGGLEIDNNGAERAIKPIVLGRKNWLHIGSEAAAHRTMVLLTLVQTCKAHQVDPFAYLRDVIDRVSTHPASRIEELTPRRWKELRQQAPDSQAA
ncbi:MAG: IS66 family transposase [Alphaproteobacteria bacterium]|nr:MAG: IS66 family transposase [Alphaproteobacteria bacterium]